MKSLPWLRLYTEIIDDEKLGLLAFEDRWHFVALLCLKGKGVLDGEPDFEMLQSKVALKMGLTCQELEKVVKRLTRMRLIDGDTLQPLAWDARQMQSDSSTERVQAYRERMKQVKQPRNVSVTAQDTDTDTEEDIYVAKADPLPAVKAQAVIDLFHEVLPELPRVRLLSDKRKKAIASFCKWVLTSKRSDGQHRAQTQDELLVWVRNYFERARDNDFLMGRGQRSGSHANWECDIDFLLSEKGIKQVIEKTREAA